MLLSDYLLPVFSLHIDMGRLTRVLLLLSLASVVGWYALQRKLVKVLHDGSIDFLFDPTERFELDSKYSWIFTVAVILVASSIIAI